MSGPVASRRKRKSAAARKASGVPNEQPPIPRILAKHRVPLPEHARDPRHRCEGGRDPPPLRPRTPWALSPPRVALRDARSPSFARAPPRVAGGVADAEPAGVCRGRAATRGGARSRRRLRGLARTRSVGGGAHGGARRASWPDRPRERPVRLGTPFRGAFVCSPGSGGICRNTSNDDPAASPLRPGRGVPRRGVERTLGRPTVGAAAERDVERRRVRPGQRALRFRSRFPGTSGRGPGPVRVDAKRHD